LDLGGGRVVGEDAAVVVEVVGVVVVVVVVVELVVIAVAVAVAVVTGADSADPAGCFFFLAIALFPPKKERRIKKSAILCNVSWQNWLSW